MWVPRSATADWPADDCIGSVCSTACNATAPARCSWIRDAAIVRRDPAGNSARPWVFLNGPGRVPLPGGSVDRRSRSLRGQ